MRPTCCTFIADHVLRALSESSRASEHVRQCSARALSINASIRNERLVAQQDVAGFVPPYVTPAVDESEPQDREIRRVRAERSGNLADGPASKGGSVSLYDCRQSASLPGTLIRKDDTQRVKDRVVNNAYDGLRIALEFFEALFKRKSLDDASLPLIGSVHYRSNYNNSMFDGRQMIFGDGDGEVFDYFADSLDVIVHELAHGITQYTANLQYQDQSGALNESISDVFACMAEQWHFSQTAAEGDWILGQNIFPVARRGVALRSLKEPGTAYNDSLLGKDPQVGHMQNYIKTADDNGGVHLNSGIPNHAFYLAATELGGHSWERAGQIWYRALTDRRITSTCTFKEFAELTVSNAQESDGKAGSDIVRHAWVSVGVL